MRAHRARFGMLTAGVALVVLSASAPARAETSVTHWNELAATALVRDAGQGAFGVAHLAMVHGAVYDAVNAIDRRYRPYLGAPRAKRWYSKDAAVATAAYQVLVGSRPSVVTAAQQATLEALVTPAYEASLAAIPDGRAKDGGIATGNAAARRMIRARFNDGRFEPHPFTEGLLPGQWRPTSGINDPGAWLRDVKPFLIRSSSQFLSRGPNPLTSRRYATDFAEVKLLGKSDSAARTTDQTDAARFWGAANGVGTWSLLFRNLANEQGLTTTESARFYAMLYLSAADTLITTWVDKEHWSFWRPVTAIHEADDDDNPATEADADWQPLVATPPYPEHASGLSAFSGSNAKTLRDFFGTDQVAFGGINAAAERHYASFSQALDEVIDARVWGGIHFRTADIQGARIGKQVARWREDHGYFRPLGGHH